VPETLQIRNRGRWGWAG